MSLSLRIYYAWSMRSVLHKRKYTSVVTQPQGETADMGNTMESISAMQELFKSLLDERKRREEEVVG